MSSILVAITITNIVRLVKRTPLLSNNKPEDNKRVSVQLVEQLKLRGFVYIFYYRLLADLHIIQGRVSKSKMVLLEVYCEEKIAKTCQRKLFAFLHENEKSEISSFWQSAVKGVVWVG